MILKIENYKLIIGGVLWIISSYLFYLIVTNGMEAWGSYLPMDNFLIGFSTSFIGFCFFLYYILREADINNNLEFEDLKEAEGK